ncbi:MULTISPECIES: c-type cytochrome [unclassified Ruegeria]|uniref:c-type cytochrome n=1 Tax=unclassified Ruegeria TaxID=2625375 RepID=UPI001ADA1DC9|nr:MULTISPECIES: c-type cytochrome [unclassified Ruegeria]MBO9412795.1 c-type cytochrome [Ruegeria sp. R8_1]MBO9416657.1 c-type cytochrome [Ruegeria sp. R8_2]
MRGLVLALALLPLPAWSEFFTLKGHGGPIMGIATASDGRIATASFDNSVGIWSNQMPEWLEGHEAAVNAVAFNGTAIYSAGDDFTLRRWPGGEVVGQHKGKIVHIAASKTHVATASWDGTIGLWPADGSDPTVLSAGGGVNAVVFTPDGSQLYSAGVDGALRLWDVASGQETLRVVEHGFGINELVLNAQDNWIAYGAVDGVTRIRDLTTGEERDFTLDRRPILALALSPDRSLLAVGDGEGYIMLIDTVDWRIAQDFRATLRGPVWALAFSPDGQNIHAGGIDEAMYSWPIAALREQEQMAAVEPSFLKNPDQMSNGERQFARKCSICHSLTPDGQRRAGPTLHGVFGRKAGTLPGYFYSDTLQDSDIIWNDETINALFDEGPDHYIPGSKMPMQRITQPSDRDDLVAFLRRATAPEN